VRTQPIRQLIALLALAVLAAPAAEINGVSFPDQLAIGSDTVPLRGTAVMKWKRMVTVHASAVWLPPGQDALADVPKAFELHYFHDIDAADFRKATEESLAASAAPEAIAALRPRIDRFNALYQDITQGQRYRLTYRPRVGTELAKDGAPLGIIEGADFAHAIFGIWLGPKAIDDSFRDRVLGK